MNQPHDDNMTLADMGDMLIRIGRELKARHAADTPRSTRASSSASGRRDEEIEHSAEQLIELVAFREAQAFFEAHRQDLLTEYESKYVAILDGQVVDSDDDFAPLAERVYRRVGYRDVFMPRVERQPSVMRIPSPRLSTKERGNV